MDPPETRYARSGDVRIAYQVTGGGPLDLVFVPGFVSNLDLWWENPAWVSFFARLTAFSRVILFDKRGTGLSDRISGAPDLETRMDDVRAVMDAVGSERAAVVGVSEGGAMSMLFAATHPDRARALVLYGTYPHYPTWVLSGEKLEAFIEAVERDWGTGESIRFFMSSRASDEAARRGWARWERQGGSPSTVVALTRMNYDIDVRHILPAIRVPTLVLHRIGDTRVAVEAGRYLGTHIAGARYVELLGEDHVPVDISDRLADEIEEFLTGSRTEAEPDRVLATVMFTDIVDSTKTCRRTRRPRLACSSREARRRHPAGAQPFSRPRSKELGRRISRDLRRSGARRALRRGDRRSGPSAWDTGAQWPSYRRDRVDAG
jgi:pimeloyl-ACP methyl ester carboxylesterase